MSAETQPIWQAVAHDLNSAQVLWELVVLLTAAGIAALLDGILRVKIARYVPTSSNMALGGINRILFPLSALLVAMLGKWLLPANIPHGLLRLAIGLLLAMVLVRLAVYSLRYIFSPSGMLKTFERLIAWLVWGAVALHLIGYLNPIIDALEHIQFRVGKNPVNLWIILQGLLIVIATLFVALWLSRIVENKLMRADQVSVNMRVVLIKLIRILFIAIAILFALSAVGLDITLLSVFGGALGVGLGFGLQKIASNYVSGFIILLDKSMQIGDAVSVDKHYGVIQDMRSRYTVLGKQDGTNVIIPNETLITSAVVNHSLLEHRGRVQVSVFVSFNSPLETAQKLMRDITAKHTRVQKTPKPEALIRGFGEHGAELVLYVWVADPETPTAPLQSALYLDIWKAFQANDIKFAKPEVKLE